METSPDPLEVAGCFEKPHTVFERKRPVLLNSLPVSAVFGKTHF
jgi:hypothetical protein